MPTVPCPKCSTSNTRRRVRCRGCGGVLGSPRPPTSEREKATRLVMEVQRHRLQEREAAAKRHLKEWERRLREREVALRRREMLVAGGGSALEVSPGRPRRRSAATPIPGSLPNGGLAPKPIPRIATHVPGLDDALRGGVPQGSVVLISGAPGTMKTSLGLFILATNAISEERRGMYVTFGQRAESVLRQLDGLGLDVAAATPRLDILDMTMLSRTGARGTRDWLKEVRDRVEGVAGDPLELLVIDSLDALEVVARLENRRQQLFRLFEWLRDLNLTSFVISERSDFIVRGTVIEGRNDEDFLADGVIQLRLHPVTDLEIQRRVRIVKMRGTAHDTGYLAVHVSEGKAFEVAPAIGA